MTQVVQERSFEHKGRELCVRATLEGDHIAVRIVDGVQQVAPVSYVIAVESRPELMSAGRHMTVLFHLMRQAEEDVKLGNIPITA